MRLRRQVSAVQPPFIHPAGVDQLAFIDRHVRAAIAHVLAAIGQDIWGLDNGISIEELNDEFGADQVHFIQSLMENSAYYRDTPYSLI